MGMVLVRVRNAFFMKTEKYTVQVQLTSQSKKKYRGKAKRLIVSDVCRTQHTRKKRYPTLQSAFVQV